MVVWKLQFSVGFHCVPAGSWISSVSVLTRLWLGRMRNRGSIASRGGDFCFLKNLLTGSGSHPSCLGVPGAFFSGGKAGSR